MNFNAFSELILPWLRAAAVSLSVAAPLCVGTHVSAAENAAAHHFFVDQDGSLWAWGENAYGQLGLGTETEVDFPLEVAATTKISAVATGMRHTLALGRDGAVWAWGDNSAGQLGEGGFKSSTLPQRLDLRDVVALAAGDWHSAALDQSGQVWTWGSGVFGQLGDGKGGRFATSSLPVKVDGLPKVVAISSGSNHLLALCDDGTVWAWGRNLEGQLGSPVTRFRDRPARVEALSGIVRVLASGNASQAVGQDGAVWLWGNAPGMGQNQPVPVRVGKPVLSVPEAGAYEVGGVVKEGKHPVRGASVSIDGNGCGQSDATGRYRCIVPTGYRGSVLARKDGLVFHPVRLGKTRRVTLNLVGRADTLKISGTVVGPTRKPIQGVELAARNARCTNSNSHGGFVCEVPYGWSGRLIGKRKEGAISESDLIRSVTHSVSGFVFPVDVAMGARPTAASAKPAEQAQPVKPVQPATVLRPAKPAALPEGSTARGVPAGIGDKAAQSGEKRDVATLRESHIKAAAPSAPAQQAEANPTVHAGSVRIGGVVTLATGLGSSSGSPVANVLIAGENAQCSPSDSNGEYSCLVPSGWNGRLAPSKRNYLFSPSVILFKELRDDRQQQDFRATFAP